MQSINLNGKMLEIDAPEDMPLLWAVRDIVGYTGTKFGCGMGLCGACTMHIDGQPIRSCITPISVAKGKQVTTLDHLHNDAVGKIVQEAWLSKAVAQCGYCQGGQMMAATALLKSTPNPDMAQIEAAMSGTICRCGTYNRIKDAIQEASVRLKEQQA